ncbi:YeeE/YedE family protein [Actimicrobium sp. CCI2.3]|uniref:YeeE/YedE family protein n=1 Tax=Actimicrobium sp. CCI2.3 TaxID=3048616 RepID=UPI002AB3D410|nr:YeeE/YedE family protein [Actimicrobium sp. CCI2.3]MDY7575457.1 YeeE/YedE family protein [Actimicrobium sp. CCI2.3]MEB0021368.1 YeeE/YedE family protein [Actimicrobium sp. CCI2.3]
MKLLSALLCGLVFGLGLILSGMTDPTKVIGFLDLAGNWDPSLGLVMGGAVAVGLITFRFSARRTKAFLGDAMHIPTARQLDRRLVLGGITFGVGWGLAGYCPGPALASLASGGFQAVLFVAAMLAGMALFAMIDKR